MILCDFHWEQVWLRWLSSVSDGMRDNKELVLPTLRKIASSEGIKRRLSQKCCWIKEQWSLEQRENKAISRLDWKDLVICIYCKFWISLSISSNFVPQVCFCATVTYFFYCLCFGIGFFKYVQTFYYDALKGCILITNILFYYHVKSDLDFIMQVETELQIYCRYIVCCYYVSKFFFIMQR